ncbi:GAF domain-containing sensor histidine kinase [Aeromicrobium chenweiae]|uniref:GAF domain-containing sensor histidine kinase n=1 Tax=Aeromicrobium chenweiae TaxID=2079793 RepID=UPI00131F1B36|nr:GAF domain-containing protein [Aeromicrobium chenweiae]
MTAERLRSVLDAVATMSSDLSIDGLLERILRQAGDLVDAESGFLDALDRRLGSFAAYGIDGVVDDQHPGRQLLVDLLEQDPTAFIGVPIRIQDYLFGNLYLIGKRSGGGFTQEDEEIVLALASAAGVVIENARLYEEGERQRRWLEAAAEITTTLLSPISRTSALLLVADRARDVAIADFVALLMPGDDETLVVEAVSGLPAEGILGGSVDARHSIAGDAARLRETIVVPDTALEPRYEAHKTPSWPDLGSFMVLPLRSGDDTGALLVGWLKGSDTLRWELDPMVPQRFADQAALVLQVARAQEDQARLAVFEDRDRIGRDLHDLVIQRLFGIGLMLDNTTKLIPSQTAADRLSSAIDDIDETIMDIRRTIFALSPGTGTSDLRAELEQVLRHSAKLLGFTPELRLIGPVDSVVPDEVREHLMAVVGEALSNVVRHAQASKVGVVLEVGQDIALVVSDDGNGLSDGQAGNGLRNIRVRAALLRGRCEVSSEPGSGTTITWTVPRSAS